MRILRNWFIDIQIILSIRRIRERGLCLIEVTLDIINKEEDDEGLLRMQNQAIDENDEGYY